jgi:hypothetical protein
MPLDLIALSGIATAYREKHTSTNTSFVSGQGGQKTEYVIFLTLA